MEIWKEIKGYNASYEVSNLGNIRSKTRVITNKNGKQQRFNGRLLKSKMSKHGYLEVTLYEERNPYMRLVHRIVAETFIPNPENKPQVNHINGDKKDNRVSNLEWVTPRENNLHANATGLVCDVEQRQYVKLNREKVIEIRKLFSSRQYTMASLSRMYNVEVTTIKHLLEGKTWKDVPMIEYDFDFKDVYHSSYKGRFTLEELKKIKELREMGLSNRKIAKELGVPHTRINNAVKKYLHFI